MIARGLPRVLYRRKPVKVSIFFPFTYTHRLPREKLVASLFWDSSFTAEVKLLTPDTAASLIESAQVPPAFYLRDKISGLRQRLRSKPQKTKPGKADDNFWTWDTLTTYGDI